MKCSDLDTGEIVTLDAADLDITLNNITFTTEHLRLNRRYNTTITATNANSSATSYFMISKYTVKITSVTGMRQGFI